MRLIDLDPEWYVTSYWGDNTPGSHTTTGKMIFYPDAPVQRQGMGIIFDCPVHRSPCRIAVPFANPTDGLPKAAEGTGENKDKWWQRAGETFETLSLTPSVHVQDKQPDGSKVTHWHGHITNGEVA